MKKCPFCGAEIEENARFCLYCMTPLEEKQVILAPKVTNKRWLYITAAVFLLVLLIAGVWWKMDGQNSKNQPITPESESERGSSTDTTANAPTKTTVFTPDTTDRTGSQTVAGRPAGPITTATTARTPTTVTALRQTAGPVSVTPTTSSPVTVTYTYREGTVADCYPAGHEPFQAPQDVIVITGVNTVSPNGVYDIPETINGKKVAAIMPSAFGDPLISGTVRSVFLPAGVRMVWGDAFKNCYNLTDLYIRSAAIDIEETAFPATANRTGTLTIHCAADCRDLDYYYYRNIASRYGAQYKEWNG